MNMTHKEALHAACDVHEESQSMDGLDCMEAAIRAYLDARGLVMVSKVDVTDEMIEAYDKAEWAKRADIMNPHPTEEYHAGGGPIGYGLRAAIAAAPDTFADADPIPPSSPPMPERPDTLSS